MFLLYVLRQQTWPFSEVFNLDVKDHVASYLLVSNWVQVSDLINLERNSHILHFFGDGVLPQCVPIFLIEPNGLFNCLWILDPEVAVSFVVSIFYRSNNMFPLLEGKFNPPCEGWLVIDASSLSVFGRLDRVGFLYVGQLFP